jgi:uncharacterized protein (DUF427 family)
VRALWDGTVIAESDATVVVEGNHYFPAEAIRWDLLSASEHRSTCPWKGRARYWSIDGGGGRGADVAWSYPDPSAAARAIAGRVAFWRGVTVEG